MKLLEYNEFKPNINKQQQDYEAFHLTTFIDTTAAVLTI